MVIRMQRSVIRISLSILLLGISFLPAEPIMRAGQIYRPASGRNGAVAAAEPHAAQAGLDVLKAGGNAVDSAVTVGFCLAVTLPRAGNIGGGGFLLYHGADTEETYALDYRETAPASAHRDMFLNESGDVVADRSRNSPLASGVPGTVAGLLEAHRRFGTLPLQQLIEPAIRLARQGFPVHEALLEQLRKVESSDRFNPVARCTYLGPDDTTPELGDIFRQPELANTLERIALHGRDGFYTGPVAEDIVDSLSEMGGFMTLGDLANYKPVWRDPVMGDYQGNTIVSMPPPSSGGVHLIQMLNLLENFPLSEWGHNSLKSSHIMIEVMKRAYADRSKYLGDPDFSDVPVGKLISEAYEQSILEKLDLREPTPSTDIRPGTLPIQAESPETTHFSIVDAEGNAVSNTYTMNFSFGSGIMTNNTGILMNNEMDDFSAKPGVPNAYGLIGGEANAVHPGKRPLSSMTPTIVLKDGKVHVVTGSPGGSRIINTVLHVILNLLMFDMNAAEANHAPRFHHQWLPDRVRIERGFPVDTYRMLEELGYEFEKSENIGSAQTIVRDTDGGLSASTDPRRLGGTALVY
jgi:gamma-glutamyltranspeptidase/glutathione hydrolase